eukprot:TRINITY_DN13288_c0_g1_i1.p1 TRINITY_DN13288_c0_g1~~TRINITY_DN13288_c0_g1_i1.p1  ORF type:complete len:144 (+),score=12.61 TRINITY_DN13288_c0_g1_i1:95-526(+)
MQEDNPQIQGTTISQPNVFDQLIALASSSLDNERRSSAGLPTKRFKVNHEEYIERPVDPVKDSVEKEILSIERPVDSVKGYVEEILSGMKIRMPKKPSSPIVCGLSKYEVKKMEGIDITLRVPLKRTYSVANRLNGLSPIVLD